MIHTRRQKRARNLSTAGSPPALSPSAPSKRGTHPMVEISSRQTSRGEGSVVFRATRRTWNSVPEYKSTALRTSWNKQSWVRVQSDASSLSTRKAHRSPCACAYVIRCKQFNGSPKPNINDQIWRSGHGPVLKGGHWHPLWYGSPAIDGIQKYNWKQ